MARVIDTPTGAVLTSPVNAHAFGRGDQVVIGKEATGYAVLTVASVRIPKDAPGRCWLEFEGMLGPVNPTGCGREQGPAFGMEFGLNEPLPRVTGSRS